MRLDGILDFLYISDCFYCLSLFYILYSLCHMSCFLDNYELFISSVPSSSVIRPSPHSILSFSYFMNNSRSNDIIRNFTHQGIGGKASFTSESAMRTMVLHIVPALENLAF